MTISFIIPLYNAETTISRCIASIKAQLCPGDEIIVVDNGSIDGSLNAIGLSDEIKTIIKPGVTISAVRNTGAEKASGSILAFIDSDCILSPGWRDNVVNVMTDGTVSATGSKVDIPEDALWIEKAWYSQRAIGCSRVSYINSGNLVIRKNIFEEVGGFSEMLETGEDSELGWRINRAGYTILSNPLIRSVHLGNPKNLKNFYRKEKWHALGMMGTFEVSSFNKPLIMTVAFLACNISAMFLLLLFTIRGNAAYGIFTFVILTVSVPVATALYRAVQFNNSRYFFHLICLYWIYFVARANVLVAIGCNKLNSLPCCL